LKKKLSSQVFGYRDQEIRLNAALKSFSSQDISRVHLENVFLQEVIVIATSYGKFKLDLSNNITCNGDRTSLKNIEDMMKDKNGEVLYVSVHPRRILQIKQLDQLPASTFGEQTSTPKIQEIMKSESFSYFRVESMPIWKISSFAPSDFSEFASVVVAAGKELLGKGEQRLILDVTNNDGGSICLAIWIAKILVNHEIKWMVYDTKKHPLVEYWINQNLDFVGGLVDPSNEDDSNWYNKDISKIFENEKVIFTKKGFVVVVVAQLLDILPIAKLF
jgi:hypothetical protein